MTRAMRSTKRLAIGTALTMVLAGLAAILAGIPAWRTPTSVAASAANEMRASTSTGKDVDRAEKSRLQAMLGKLPLYFVRNRGQEDSRVAYYLQGRNTAVYFGTDGITFALSSAKSNAGDETQSPRVPVRLVSTRPEGATATERWAVKLDFVGANRVTPAGQELAPAVVSYFKGRDNRGSVSSETYRGVTYAELWPGIDLVYTGAGGQLKSTFVVKPGADPSQIRLAYRGATGVRLTEAGQLEVSTPAGSFADDCPYAYQDVSGDRSEVPVAFALASAAADGARGYGFRVGRYDRSKTLVLDPTFLVYAGYIGGAGTDEATGIAVDASGNAYVVGSTTSTVPSFPAKVGPDLIFNGGNQDVFVAKVKADGSDLVYLGYIGGAGYDAGNAIAVDAAGNAYIAGVTDSHEGTFPVKVGPGLTHSGLLDAFVAKVKADGTTLVYCGYIGGAGDDYGYGIDVDNAGNAYVSGVTGSDETSFPVKVGPDLAYSGGWDAFVAKVKADGTGLVYAGYIGGAGDDLALGIAVDPGGNAYVAGSTTSDQTTFPVKVGPNLTFNGGQTDAFVAKVKADGSSLVYAGYIGGAGDEQARAIAVDAAGSAYLTGFTTSNEGSFPVKVGPDTWYSGGQTDAFVAKVKADGTALVYAGYIGGAGHDIGYGIAVDAGGNAYVAGITDSNQSTFPVNLGPSLHLAGSYDAFVAKVKPDGTALLWAGYIGGTSNDRANAIAVDAKGNAYVAGTTSSSEASFPVTGGPDLVYAGGLSDAFVAKVSGAPDLYESFVGLGATVAKPGGSLAVADVVANAGLGDAPASKTRYYLSTDTVKSVGDILLGGSRAVPSLLPGSTHGAWATVTLPTTTPVGDYHVIACADDPKVISEVDETNNCSATGSTVQVALPDLVVSVAGNPPAVAKPGDKFQILVNIFNLGPIGAPASTARHYLSTDIKKGAGDILLTGSGAVPALNPGGTPGDKWAAFVWVTIPANTAVGTYYVLSCADDLNIVKETFEDNNCKASTATVNVTLPNLKIEAVSSPPSSIQRGHSFSVTDTVANTQPVSAGASTTRYYLSKDVFRGAGDLLLTGSRAVVALGPLGSASGSATVTVPSGTTPGVYYVLACADDLDVVKELIEQNNCNVAASTVTVTP